MFKSIFIVILVLILFIVVVTFAMILYLNKRKENFMIISSDGFLIDNENKTYPDNWSKPPNIISSKATKDLYSVNIFDKNYTHWLVVNLKPVNKYIYDKRYPSYGNTVVEYIPLKPGSYTLNIYKQSKHIEPQSTDSFYNTLHEHQHIFEQDFSVQTEQLL